MKNTKSIKATDTTERDELLAVIQWMVNGATVTKGQDSCERDYAYIRQDILDLGREVLKRHSMLAHDRR